MAKAIRIESSSVGEDCVHQTKENEDLLRSLTTARILANEERKQAEIEADDDVEDVLVEQSTESVPFALPSKQSRTLEICISGLSGELCKLTADPAMRVRDVKTHVAMATKTPVCQQRLFLGHAELGDQELVLDATPPSSPVADLTMVRIDPEWQHSLEMVSIAGMQLAVVSPNLRSDRAIVSAAVRQNGASLEFAIAEHKADFDIVMVAVQDCGLALAHANSDLRANRKVVLAAVQENGMALQYASEALRGDEELVLAAARNASKAFQFASEDLRDDRAFVLLVVDVAGLALEFVSINLRSDVEVVVVAVRQDGLALEYACDELRAERSVVWEAVQQNGLALWDAAEELKSDPDIIAACKFG